MANTETKKIIDDLNQGEGFKKLWCARSKLLKENIDDIKEVLKDKDSIEELLRIKYAINMPISNIGLKTFWTILFTVILTENIKWLITGGKAIFNTPQGWIGIILLFLGPYAIVYSFSNEYYGSPVGRFKKVRNNKIITDLIDIEIEKRKKALENNTSAEND